MKRSRNPLPWKILFLLPGLLLALSGAPPEAAVLDQYCQYPPYVLQSKLPSVMLLVSNSYSMSGFAYMNNTSDTEANASDGFVPGHRYFGYFDPDYWYTSTWTKTATKTTSSKPGAAYWHGSFLNWLTMRRIDVVNKLLTGGIDVGSNSSGYQSCGNDNTLFKKYVDDGYYSGSQQSGKTVYAEFTHKTSCTGKNTSGLSLYYYQGATKKAVGSYSVVGDPPTGNGLIQRNLPKAQIGLAFYNEKGDGANITVPTKSAWSSSDWNKLKTPSQYNNEADQPLADALFSIAGYFAQVANADNLVNTTTLGACTSSSPCGPDYAGSGFATRSTASDPFYQHGGLSQCTKGNVIVLTDGEPCSDGNLPTRLAHFADSTLFHCDGATCPAAPGFTASAGPPACISRSGVSQVGREKGSLEDVALWAHTTDLRNDIPNTRSKQNLDIWIVRAFGFSTSNLLKYAAINGSFDDTAGTGKPAVGTYSLDQSYFEADDPYAIERALDDIFRQLLRRATSGTAASVLASGEGSGANLVQAVFYPKRRFFEEVIEWTGTLQNLWYYVDPFFSGASIREDSDHDSDPSYNPVLNLVTDNTILFYFDQTSQTTKVARFANDSNGNATGTPDNTVSFENVKSIWEAGSFLHARSPTLRTIFTAIDNTVPRTHLAFTGASASTLRSYLGAASDTEASNIINYLRGYDDVNGDNVVDFRPRTVPYPANTASDNTVWKLGDIINSTPKIASRVALNTYEKTYFDTTYKDFINSPTYRNRGMVLVGANDGMLHAFKLGRLEFPGDNNWTSYGAKDRARLRNLDTSVPLGAEQWAFIPKNALPYLKAMLDNDYCHLYTVDLSPHLFDASIGAPPAFVADDAARTAASWRSILIGGMRFGGACAPPSSGRANAVDVPATGLGYSSYFAIDVTNPDSPTVLWEFSNPALGFATTGPSIVRINALNGSGVADRTLNGKWFVVIGSGPTGPITDRQFLGKSDQTLKLFVLDLRTGALLRTIDQDNAGATVPNAFAGSMMNSTADFNLDYQDDAVYIGYVKENAGVWNQGGVMRLQTKGDTDPANWVASRVIDGIGPVTSSVVRLQSNTYHTNWLFFGTGRYYYATETTRDDATIGRNLFGVKDPCFTEYNTINPSCTTTVSAADLNTVLDTTIIDESVANGAAFRGWKIDLDTTASVNYDGTDSKNYQAERVITDPLAAATGVVFFTTYRPYSDDCAIGGRTFLWGVRYNTGGVPAYALQGKALMQVSTASVEQLDLGDAFSRAVAGAVSTLHRGGRRSYSLEGVPPTAQGLSILSQPPALKRMLHMKER